MPILEPEVLADGDHSLAEAAAAAERVRHVPARTAYLQDRSWHAGIAPTAIGEGLHSAVAHSNHGDWLCGD